MNLTLLKEFFAGFLRTRHIARHFRRLALLENFTDTTVSREMPPTLAQTLVSAANSDTGQLLDNLNSHTDGLSEAEALGKGWLQSVHPPDLERLTQAWRTPDTSGIWPVTPFCPPGILTPPTSLAPSP